MKLVEVIHKRQNAENIKQMAQEITTDSQEIQDVLEDYNREICSKMVDNIIDEFREYLNKNMYRIYRKSVQEAYCEKEPKYMCQTVILD